MYTQTDKGEDIFRVKGKETEVEELDRQEIEELALGSNSTRTIYYTQQRKGR